MKEHTIPVTVPELKQLVLQAARLGGIQALKYQQGFIISQNQAYQRYGKAVIEQLCETGIISPRKRCGNHYVMSQYNVMEIEAALVAMQIDSGVRWRIKKEDTIVGIKALASAYHCSIGKAKILRRKLATACSKQGKEVVIDLVKADKIIPIPKPKKS